MKKSELSDSEIQARSIEALNQSIEQMPDHLSQSLKEARTRALNHHQQKSVVSRLTSYFRLTSPTIWGGAIAAILVMALFLMVPPHSEQGQSVAQQDTLGDFMQIAQLKDDDYEVASDLDFAYWLSTVPDKRGVRLVKFRHPILIFNCLLLAPCVYAASKPVVDEQFLIYLAEMKKVDGKLMSPMDVEDLKMPGIASKEDNQTGSDKMHDLKQNKEENENNAANTTRRPEKGDSL